MKNKICENCEGRNNVKDFVSWGVKTTLCKKCANIPIVDLKQNKKVNTQDQLDEIQEDTTSMEEKLEALAEIE